MVKGDLANLEILSEILEERTSAASSSEVELTLAPAPDGRAALRHLERLAQHGEGAQAGLTCG